MSPEYTLYLWKPWLGWEYFHNTGIAFSLPFPLVIILVLTPIILAALFFLAKKQSMLYLIAFGALSNYIDRLFFGGTIDYLRILTGVFNIADAMIVAGVLFALKKNFPLTPHPSD